MAVRICMLHLHVSHTTTVWLAYIRRKWSQPARCTVWVLHNWGDVARLAAVTARFVYRLRAPTSLLFKGYRGLNCWGVRLIPHFHLVPMLRMRGVKSPFPHSPSWRAYGVQLFSWFSSMWQNLGLQEICKGHVLRDRIRDVGTGS
jgi:hypothetical protein